MAKQKKKKPHTIKGGRGTKAKIWQNSNKNGSWFNVNITGTYKDDEGELRDSDSFSRDDLLHVAYLAQKSFDYILDQANQEQENDDE